MKSLNHLGSKSYDDLRVSHGSSTKYKLEDFSDVEFLNSHCCKEYVCLFIGALCCMVLLLTGFVFSFAVACPDLLREV